MGTHAVERGLQAHAQATAQAAAAVNQGLGKIAAGVPYGSAVVIAYPLLTRLFGKPCLHVPFPPMTSRKPLYHLRADCFGPMSKSEVISTSQCREPLNLHDRNNEPGFLKDMIELGQGQGQALYVSCPNGHIYRRTQAILPANLRNKICACPQDAVDAAQMSAVPATVHFWAPSHDLAAAELLHINLRVTGKGRELTLRAHPKADGSPKVKLSSALITQGSKGDNNLSVSFCA